ncbi:MAG: pyruvate ferredoxin oxidoreductase [Gaiellaceae bacterium]
MATEVARKLQLLTGGEAVAQAMCQIDPDVMPVYPITPQTPIIQVFARLVANGKATTEIVNVESEHSAMSATISAALAGARSMTATSSQGLALMAEMVYIAAGMRAPLVMAMGNRALSAPLNIHCDHSDSMLVRDSGAIQLFAESAQEAYDLMVMAPRVAEHPDVLLPVLVCQDGFTITHSAEPVEMIADELVKAFVGDYDVPFALLDVQHPMTMGAFALPDYYFELRQHLVAAMKQAEGVIEEVTADFRERFGRGAGLLEAYALDGAERVVVAMGSTAGAVKDIVDELRAKGEKVGLLRIVSYRPFPAEQIRAALAGAKTVIVLDRSDAPGAFPSLHAEIATALYGSGIELQPHVFGLGGRELLPDEARAAFAGEAPRYIGLRSER